MERVAHEQKEDKELRKLKEKQKNKKTTLNNNKHKSIKMNVINDVELMTYNNRIYIPHSLWRDTMNWYHHYLQHPGASRMEKESSIEQRDHHQR